MFNNLGTRSHEIANSSLEAIQHNPIPVIAVGLGLGWVFARSFRKGTLSSQSSEALYPVEPETDGALPEELYQSGLENPGERDYRQGGDLAESRRLQKVFTASREAANSIRQKTSHLAQRMKGASINNPGTSSDERKQRQVSLAKMYDKNPLAVAAALFTFGAFIGMLTPEADKEREVMGKARQRIDHRLREIGHDTLEKVKDVARVSVNAAKEEAGKQNFPGY